MPQRVHHWIFAVFENNIEHISELIVLLEVVFYTVGEISPGNRSLDQ